MVNHLIIKASSTIPITSSITAAPRIVIPKLESNLSRFIKVLTVMPTDVATSVKPITIEISHEKPKNKPAKIPKINGTTTPAMAVNRRCFTHFFHFEDISF